MLKSIWVYLFISISTVIHVNAQIGKGCYVGGVLYTNNNSKGNRYFYQPPGDLYSVCGYNPTGNSGNCFIYNSGPISNINSYIKYIGGFSNDWEEIECPIDDYVWVLLILCVVVSIFKFKLIALDI